MSINKELIRWRVARELRGKGVAQLVGYIDGRTCMNMLDEMDPKWSVSHSAIISDGKLIGVQAYLEVGGITRSDVGVPSNQDPVKGAFSDALKRAAVHFGIGRELYELPQVYAGYDSEAKAPTQKPTFNEETGKWEISAPGWVWYPDEEPDPSTASTDGLSGILDMVKAILAARPDLKSKSAEYVKTNNLDKTKADDMQKLVDWLDSEANKEES